MLRALPHGAQHTVGALCVLTGMGDVCPTRCCVLPSGCCSLHRKLKETDQVYEGVKEDEGFPIRIWRPRRKAGVASSSALRRGLANGTP